MLSTVLVKDFSEKFHAILKFPKRRFLFYLIVLAIFVVLGGCGNSDYTWGWYVITHGTLQDSVTFSFCSVVWATQSCFHFAQL